MDLASYDTGDFYDEMFSGADEPRPGASAFAKVLSGLSAQDLRKKQGVAERDLLQRGITFNVYGAEGGTERIFPFDVVPRVVSQSDFSTIERGLRQRILALNAFVGDVYGKRKILSDGVIPEALVLSAKGYLPQCNGIAPPKGIFCHVVGTDLVRDRDGQFYVLEDNLRCPSGVSYVLENRRLMKRSFPHVLSASRVQSVDEYPSRLLGALRHLSSSSEPVVALLTPGAYNSAYFEHAFLAQQMGIELVEGRDLVVHKGVVCMRTTRGYERVDVIYRRIDDVFLDPEAFRKDSLLGVPGLFQVFKEGRVGLANAPGNGVADDKAVYAYVPKMIKYYLGEDPILPNVPTFSCEHGKERDHVLENLAEMVVKPVNESGGYGIVVGPKASKAELETTRAQILENGRNYVAQPVIGLSRVPTLVGDELEGRHVDLRPYALFGSDVWVLPGGLTRVALKKGSLVVNSSQGGGSKDTWVLGDRASSETNGAGELRLPPGHGSSQSQTQSGSSQSQTQSGSSQSQTQSGSSQSQSQGEATSEPSGEAQEC